MLLDIGSEPEIVEDGLEVQTLLGVYPGKPVAVDVPAPVLSISVVAVHGCKNGIELVRWECHPRPHVRPRGW